MEDEVQDINVENSRSNSPISITNDSYSNENSVSSSYTASEPQQNNKYWTREDLTPSEVPPENFFENDEEMKSFNLDSLMDVDPSVNMSDDMGFGLNNLFPIKEEPCDSSDILSEKPSSETVLPANSSGADQTVKKVTRRRLKQEAADVPPPTRFIKKYNLLLKYNHSHFICFYYRLQFMSVYEEQMLLRQLRPGAEKNALNAEQRRLYRKLSLRNTKRSVGQEPFNFDRLVAKLSGQEWSQPTVDSSSSPPKVIGVSNVLDRFQKGFLPNSVAQTRLNISFRRRLFGNDEDFIPEPFVSPYTGR